MKIRLQDLNATQKLAEALAQMLRFGDVIALYGDLGAGKTTFARALIREICGPATDVPSPTFTLVQIYDAGKDLGEIAHFDFYRLKVPDEVIEIGFEDALQAGVVIMEWPEKIGAFMPRNYLKMRFLSVPDDALARDVVIESVGDGRQDRLSDLERLVNG